MAHELFEKIKEGHPEVIERCEYGIADRGYDDGKPIRKLWDDYDIKRVISNVSRDTMLRNQMCRKENRT